MNLTCINCPHDFSVHKVSGVCKECRCFYFEIKSFEGMIERLALDE